MNLSGKTFRAISNSKNGSLNSETEMHFTSDDDIVLGHYNGGTIATGHMLAKRINDSELSMLYQGATNDGEVQAGKALARFSTDPNGDVYMNLDWQWLTGDLSQGESKWLLVRQESAI